MGKRRQPSKPPRTLFDLEDPITGVKHLSGIVSTLCESLLGPRNVMDRKGGTLRYCLCPNDVDEFMWAVYELGARAKQANDAYLTALEAER